MSVKVIIYHLTSDKFLNYVFEVRYRDDIEKYQRWIKENNIPAVMLAPAKNIIEFKDKADAVAFKLTFKI